MKCKLNIKTGKYKFPFRLCDADNKFYYGEFSVKNYSFDPSDDEMDNPGCTDIKYYNGFWETL